MKRAGALTLLIALVVVVGGLKAASGSPPEDGLSPADAIVVLGYGPPVDRQGRPAAELVRRVEKGVELYRSGLSPVMIMTGGNTYQDYYESAVMKEVAVNLGVPAEAVLEERQAMDTITNARYTAELMRERGWSSCILVSSPYHLPRAERLVQAAGLEVQTAGCAVPDNPGYRLMSALYEGLVKVQYLFIDEEELVRGDRGDGHADRIRGPVRARTEASP